MTGREYIVKTNKTQKLPTTWSNVLANPKFRNGCNE